jgi:Lipase (class 3)
MTLLVLTGLPQEAGRDIRAARRLQGDRPRNGVSMITDRDCAHLVRALYAYPGDLPVVWDHLDNGIGDDDVYWGAKIVDGCVVAVFRGSTMAAYPDNPLPGVDWIRDMRFIANPFLRADLGPVHHGFDIGMPTAAKELTSFAEERPVIVLGHSLGAARATLCCGHLIKAGCMPLARIVWGEPLSGFAQLAEIMSVVRNSRSYCNGDGETVDPVTLLPPPIGFRRATPLINVCQRPAANHPWGLPIAWHDFHLYEAATPETPIA